MERAFAAYIAHRLLRIMDPFAERAEVAGSIRRGKADVKDIEIVAEPKWQTETRVTAVQVPTGSLFDDDLEPVDPTTCLVQNKHTEEPVNLLYEKWADTERARFILRWIKPGTSEVVDWPPKPDGKYWRAEMSPKWLRYAMNFPETEQPELKLDLFLASRDNYGLILAIRTGSAEFSRALVTRAKELGRPSVDGFLRNGPAGDPIPTPDEHDVFRVLGLQYVEPGERTGPEALRPLGTRKPVLREETIGSLFGGSG